MTLAVGLTVYALMVAVLTGRVMATPKGAQEAGQLRRLLVSVTTRSGSRLAEGAVSVPLLHRLEDDPSLRGRVAGYATLRMHGGDAVGGREMVVCLVSRGYAAVVQPRLLRGSLAPLTAERLAGGTTGIVVGGRVVTAPEQSGSNSRLLLNGVLFDVSGVFANDFRGVGDVPVDAWLPLEASTTLHGSRAWLSDTSMSEVSLVARPRDWSDERMLVERVGTHVRRAFPVAAVRVLSVPVSYPESTSGLAVFRRTVAAAALLTVFVLAIVAANVLSLLGARAVTKQQEIACCLALGATPRQVVGNYAFEGMVISAIATGFAIPLLVSARAIARSWDSGVSEGFGGAPIWVAVGLALVACPPALSLVGARAARRVDITSLLRVGSATVARGVGWFRWALLTLQLSSALLLMAAATFATLEMWRARSGFADAWRQTVTIEPVLLPSVGQSRSGGDSSAERSIVAAAGETVGAIEGLPFVSAATASADLLGSASRAVRVGTAASQHAPDDWPFIEQRIVASTFFAFFGLPIISGSVPPPEAGQAVPSAIVNRRFARTFFPKEKPLGACVFLVRAGRRVCSPVVAIVEDTAIATLGGDRPRLYTVLANAEPGQRLVWYVRASAPRPLSERETTWLERVVAEHTPPLLSLTVRPFGYHLLEGADRQRRLALTVTFVTVLAVLIALGGVLSLTMELTAVMRRDAAIRVTFGARPRDVAWLVAKRFLASWMVATVLAIGLLIVGARALGFGLPNATVALVLQSCVVLQLATLCAVLFFPLRSLSAASPAMILRSQ